MGEQSALGNTEGLDPNVESNNLEDLEPELHEKLIRLFDRSKHTNNLDVRVGVGLRGPVEQARLWCASASVEEVENRKKVLEMAGAPKLASLLRPELAGKSAQPTFHLPGQSWHQWAQAADLYIVVGKKAFWGGTSMAIVAHLAGEVGLYHSYKRYEWRSKSRKWHVQLNRTETPMMVRGFMDSWEEVEAAMVARYKEWW